MTGMALSTRARGPCLNTDRQTDRQTVTNRVHFILCNDHNDRHGFVHQGQRSMFKYRQTDRQTVTNRVHFILCNDHNDRHGFVHQGQRSMFKYRQTDRQTVTNRVHFILCNDHNDRHGFVHQGQRSMFKYRQTDRQTNKQTDRQLLTEYTLSCVMIIMTGMALSTRARGPCLNTDRQTDKQTDSY